MDGYFNKVVGVVWGGGILLDVLLTYSILTYSIQFAAVW